MFALLFHKEDGSEMTENFSFENQFITDYHSFLTQMPSTQNTIAIENSDLLIISGKEIEDMYKHGKNFEKLGRKIAENLYIFAYQRIQSLLTEDAEKNT
jgi:DNA polymerase II small subunit/DNA polymerase delta subunit B